MAVASYVNGSFYVPPYSFSIIKPTAPQILARGFVRVWRTGVTQAV
jgi:hypothetical protein